MVAEGGMAPVVQRSMEAVMQTAGKTLPPLPVHQHVTMNTDRLAIKPLIRSLVCPPCRCCDESESLIHLLCQ